MCHNSIIVKLLTFIGINYTGGYEIVELIDGHICGHRCNQIVISVNNNERFLFSVAFI
jgi:hypothetical protein